MKDKLLVSVDWEDIAIGESFSTHTCPVALAIKRAVAWAFAGPDIKVTGKLILINNHIYHAPRSVLDFIRVFDKYPQRAMLTSPFKFWLRKEDGLRT